MSAAEIDDSTAGPPRASRGGAPGWVRRFWCPVLLVIASFVVMAPVTASHGQQFAPRTEWLQYDYVTKIPTQGMVHRGEEVGELTLRQLACVGEAHVGRLGDDCDRERLRLDKFPQKGITTADDETPAYYATAYAGGKLIEAAGVGNPLFAARLTGTLWLALSMVTLYALLRRFEIANLLCLGLGLTFIGSPVANWTYSYLTPAATALAFGAGLLLLAKLAVDGALRAWWLLPVSAVAVIFAQINLLGVFAATAYVLADHLLRQPRGGRARTLLPRALWRDPDRTPLVAIAATVTALVTLGAWDVVRIVTAVGPSPMPANPDSLGINALGGQAIGVIAGTLNYNVSVRAAADLAFPMPAYLGRALVWIAVFGVLGSLLTRPDGPRLTINTARFSVALVSVIGLPLLTIWLWATNRYLALPSTQAGLAVIPGVLLMFALLFNNRRIISLLTVLYGLVLIAWGLRYALLS